MSLYFGVKKLLVFVNIRHCRVYGSLTKALANRMFISQPTNVVQCLLVFAVPYDSSKPFVWSDYLTACGAKAVPNIVFKQVCVNSFCAN